MLGTEVIPRAGIWVVQSCCLARAAGGVCLLRAVQGRHGKACCRLGLGAWCRPAPVLYTVSLDASMPRWARSSCRSWGRLRLPARGTRRQPGAADGLVHGLAPARAARGCQGGKGLVRSGWVAAPLSGCRPSWGHTGDGLHARCVGRHEAVRLPDPWPLAGPAAFLLAPGSVSGSVPVRGPRAL